MTNDSPGLFDTAVSAFLQIKNEDYWVELILRVVCRTFPEVLVMENGSTDRTLDVLAALRREGLPFQLVQYDTLWRCEDGQLSPISGANSLKNKALREHTRARWVYLVDGDEIQFEASCRSIVDIVSDRPTWRRGMAHFLFNSPDDFLRVTRPFCSTVRHAGGRLFDLARTRWKEPGYDEFEPLPWITTPDDSIYSEASSHFLSDVVVLHAAHSPRSTIASWRGANDQNFRANYSTVSEDAYEPLTMFPKEVHDCRYSDHNPLLRLLRESPGVEFI
jgi:hypothetical protein